MDREQIEKDFSRLTGYDANDSNVFVVAAWEAWKLAYNAGRTAAFEEAAREMEYFGHRFYAERIRALAAVEKEPR